MATMRFASLRPSTSGRWVSVVWILIVVLVCALHLVGVILSACLLVTSPDFACYYTAAWAVRSGIPTRPWVDVINQAKEAGLETASFATEYRYPVYVAGALIPLTYLPYGTARIIWAAFLLLGAGVTGVLLARRYRFPALSGAALCVAYAPVSLGIGWGNVSVLLPLTLLLLAGGAIDRARDYLRLAGYAVLATMKLFPLLWLWIPYRRGQRRAVLVAVPIALALILVTLLSYPQGGGPAITTQVRHGAWILDPSDARLGQLNVWALVLQLTQPFRIDYAQHGLHMATQTQPLLPLDPAESVALGIALVLVALAAAAYLTARMLRTAPAENALWFFATALCLALPFTNYPYLAVTMPGLFLTLGSRKRRVRWLSLGALLLISVGRFHRYIAAVVPSLWPIANVGGVGPLLLCMALLQAGAVTDGRQAQRVAP